MSDKTIKVKPIDKKLLAINRWTGPWNGPYNLTWKKHEKEILSLIKSMNLKALTKEQLDAAAKRVNEKVNSLIPLDTERPGFRSGVPPEAHFHFKDDVYLLNQKQFQEFAVIMLKELAKKVEVANTVSFDNLMNITGEGFQQ